MRGRDSNIASILRISLNFNPRAPCGGATLIHLATLGHHANFNPRAPCGGATGFSVLSVCILPFQSTRPVRGRDCPVFLCCSHASYFNPRAPCGGATAVGGNVNLNADISIHAPRAGARHSKPASSSFCSLFQSTRPVRGRDGNLSMSFGIDAEISIHAPRAGARQTTAHKYKVIYGFQSTRPVRGRDLVLSIYR